MNRALLAAGAVAGLALVAFHQYQRSRPDIDVSAHFERLAACGIVMDAPNISLGNIAGHGGAMLDEHAIILSRDAWKRDRAFVEQSLLPHELAHLAHFRRFGDRTAVHTPRFGRVEDYLRRVTDECP